MSISPLHSPPRASPGTRQVFKELDHLGDPNADWRNKDGYILDGPEFLIVFDGLTGKALATADYIPPRGNVRAWGDNYGNRVDRFLACVAYLDGVRPSLVFCRGYYTRAVLAAWNWRDGKLTNVWTFDSDDGTPGNRGYRGQGNHQLSVGDVDGDGKDDIICGACVIGANGKGIYSTGFGHGVVSNNGSKAYPCLCAEILGDWREELIARTKDNKELRIFTTPIPTTHRIPTLVHDPIYRLSVAWQNVAYNVPAHTGFIWGRGCGRRNWGRS